jgi:hypothetical protein
MLYLLFFLIFNIQTLFASSNDDLGVAGDLFRRGCLVCSDRHYDGVALMHPEDLAENAEYKYVKISDFIKGIRRELVPNLPITRIGLTSCSIDDGCLEVLYENCLAKEEAIKDHLRIIDFYCNDFGKKSIPLIERMLNEFPKLCFINLSATSLGAESVQPLIEAILAHNEKIEAFQKIKKIIFLDSCDIRHMEDKVTIYDQMQKKGLFPENWRQIHKDFHRRFLGILPEKLLTLTPSNDSQLQDL